MNAQEYLDETEFAVRHFYSGLRSIYQIYEDAEKIFNPWERVTGHDRDKPITDAESVLARKYTEKAAEYFSMGFSQATISGAILQVAAIGIRIFSTNRTIPEDCSLYVPEKGKEKVIPFCIGKRIYGLPIGLIIYAARNQYAHWEDYPYKTTEQIFNQMARAFSDNPWYDLAFDLDPENPINYADRFLLGALDWTTYERYRSEMECLLVTP